MEACFSVTNDPEVQVATLFSTQSLRNPVSFHLIARPRHQPCLHDQGQVTDTFTFQLKRRGKREMLQDQEFLLFEGDPTVAHATSCTPH